MYVCVSEYVHDWRIHSSNANEIFFSIFTILHNIEMMLHLILMKHLDTLLIVTTSFHLCELERIKRTFPVTPNNAISFTNDWIMMIQTIEI